MFVGNIIFDSNYDLMAFRDELAKAMRDWGYDVKTLRRDWASAKS